MKNVIKYICFFLLLVLSVGCRSSKPVSGGLDKKLKGEAKARYEACLSRNFQYDYLQAKMKYTLGNKSLSGKLNIEHGKRLCMTVTVLGIEVARVEANTENVVIVDKVDKVYAQVSIAEAASRIGLENEAKLEALEALLLGRMFVPGQGPATKSDFSRLTWWPLDNNELQADYVSDKYQLSYILNGDNYLVVTQVNVPSKEASFVWEYANPLELENGTMPTRETLSVKGPQSVSADLSMSSPSVAKKGWTSFSPSSNYKQVSFSELIDIIKKMKN